MSPIATTQSAPAPKAEAHPKPDVSAHTHRRSHHDHVDPAGDYAEKAGESFAVIDQPEPASAEAPDAAKGPVSDMEQPSVEEAPMSVADAEAPVKDHSNVAAETKPDSGVKADALSIEVKAEPSTTNIEPASTGIPEADSQPLVTESTESAMDSSAAAPETKSEALAA